MGRNRGVSPLNCILVLCSSLLTAQGEPCAGTPAVGPFTVQVVETTFHGPAASAVSAAEPVSERASGTTEMAKEPKAPARSVMLQSEYFEFSEGEDFLPTSIVALRHYVRGELDILEWDTLFEGGQLVLSEHQVRFESLGGHGEHLKTIWRERPLGQGAAHTVIAEAVESGEDRGSWHVLRYGLRSRAHGTAKELPAVQGPAETRLGLLQAARSGDIEDGPLALWNGELGRWEPGVVRTIDLNMGTSLDWLQPGLDSPRAVVWRGTQTSNQLIFELNGDHCTGLQIRHRGTWARPMHPDVWRRLNTKWRREAPVQDPGARARAIQATAPFFDKRVHSVPTWHTM